MPIFEPVFRALDDAGARYIVVGGVAVVLHGHVRLTTDLDLIIDLEPAEARRTLEVLVGWTHDRPCGHREPGGDPAGAGGDA